MYQIKVKKDGKLQSRTLYNYDNVDDALRKYIEHCRKIKDKLPYDTVYLYDDEGHLITNFVNYKYSVYESKDGEYVLNCINDLCDKKKNTKKIVIAILLATPIGIVLALALPIVAIVVFVFGAFSVLLKSAN